MPNEELRLVYGDSVISAGKNKGKIRFNYSKTKEFQLLEKRPFRTKVLLWNDNMSSEVEGSMIELKNIYKQQNDNK